MSLKKILPIEQAIQKVDALKRDGKRVVFTNGCFDVLHPGHVRYMREARSMGDFLIVAVNSDRGVRELKGAGRPIFPQSERAEILAALESVDAVTIFDESTPLELIQRMRPSVLVKGGDWRLDQIVGREVVEAYGGKVVAVPPAPGFSTSSIIGSIVRTARRADS